MRSRLFDPTACLQVLAPWSKNNLLEEEVKRSEIKEWVSCYECTVDLPESFGKRMWCDGRGRASYAPGCAGVTRSILSQQLESVGTAKAAIPDWCKQKWEQGCLCMCVCVCVCASCVLTYAQACVITKKSVLSWEFRLKFSHLAFSLASCWSPALSLSTMWKLEPIVSPVPRTWRWVLKHLDKYLLKKWICGKHSAQYLHTVSAWSMSAAIVISSSLVCSGS